MRIGEFITGVFQKSIQANRLGGKRNRRPASVSKYLISTSTEVFGRSFHHIIERRSVLVYNFFSQISDIFKTSFFEKYAIITRRQFSLTTTTGTKSTQTWEQTCDFHRYPQCIPSNDRHLLHFRKNMSQVVKVDDFGTLCRFQV